MNITLDQTNFIRDLNGSNIKRAALKAELLNARGNLRELLLKREPKIMPSPAPSRLLTPNLFNEKRVVIPKPEIQPTT
jgi:hypothetical protein